MANEGKTFEKIIAQSLKDGNGYLYRLNDNMSGYISIGNPCDFFYYCANVLYCIECKTVEMARFPFSNIQDMQMDGLLKANAKKGVWGGFLIYYRSTKSTQLVNVDTVRRLYSEGKRSLSITDTGVLIKSTPLQLYSKYTVKDMEDALKAAYRMKYKGEV